MALAQRVSHAGVVLEVRALSLDYDGRCGPIPAFEDVSFTIGQGERLVLLGPSGCGKSSILKVVGGFLAPTRGDVQVRGEAVTRPGPDRILVFQEFDQLLPWKTMIENVSFALRVTRKFSERQARDRAASALTRVGLSSFLEAYPHTLSGGMKQRAAIARALAVEPDILLMDEPFAALDALTRAKLQQDLLALVEELGITLLFVTHSIEEAILIGTKLHLLSAHPGRTIAALDTQHLGPAQLGTATFESVAREAHRLLFSTERSGVNG